MKAYVIKSREDVGKPLTEAVSLVDDQPKPVPADDEVLVRVRATGLNPVDWKLVAGGNAKWTYPHVLGLDLAGDIVEVGSKVQPSWKTGMRVAGHLNLAKDGCFAEYVAVPTYELAEIPEPLGYADAAALLCGALTAYQAINRKPNLNNVDTVLVHGGAGSVGALAIQFAKLHGLRVITTVSPRKLDFVKKAAPDVVIDYTKDDVTARIAELTDGHGVDLIVDTVSGEEATKDLDRLAYNGQLVTIVGIPKIDPDFMFAHAISVAAVNLGGAHESGDPRQKKDLGEMATEVLQLAAEGEIDPMIGETIPFAGLLDGLEAIKDHRAIGKIVVTVD
ncbi:zinc-binding dehydrogenase [Bifidobacterium choloepi]|uniref:Zinc-binding dehydrogenase n=1 Tax=Bifidobacterium choloepi TaxID=2614131 RepID=A0A6I5NLB5_9BIFI|nr:zinc-binding dehydrogenase [Bifidobacterium choloepi]NEG69582.1 zinc-binding dehydrogenase [Bifidobacterium choloepi]